MGFRGLAGVALGAGLAACRREEPEPVGAVAADTDRIDFGVVPVGTEATRDVTLTNAGGAAVRVLSVTLVDGDPDVFSAVRAGDEVPAGGSLLLTVAFTPEDRRREIGQLLVRTDAPEGADAAVVVTGVGGAADEDLDGDGVSPAEGDCDDGDPAVAPGLDEACDGRDTNCDGGSLPDEGDADGDGHLACGDDCDDTDGYTYAGAPERCDGVDNACDGGGDENADGDGDGQTVCEGDCDDGEPLAFAGAAEACDGVDNDCDGSTDAIDADGDGFSACSTDCDDADGTAHGIRARPGGNPSGAGTDADPVDTVAHAIAAMPATTPCPTVYLEAGTYPDTHVEPTSPIDLFGLPRDPALVVLRAPAGDRVAVTTADFGASYLTLTGGDVAGDGGAIWVRGGELRLADVVVTQNHADGNGGGIAADGGDVSLRDVTVDGNDAGLAGGGLWARNAVVSDDLDRWIGNTAGTRGGAIALEGGTAELTRGTVRDGEAADGGGVSLEGLRAVVVQLERFAANRATGSGGGLHVVDLDAPNGLVWNNTFEDDEAQGGFGGGLALEGAVGLRILNNTFVHCAAGGEGAGLGADLAAGSRVELAANVLADNSGASGLWVAGEAPTLSSNTVWGTPTAFAGVVSDGSGGSVEPTDAVRDPLLARLTDDGDPDDDDLALQPGSPEIDSGPVDPAFDDVDGSRNDRGYTGGPGVRP